MSAGRRNVRLVIFLLLASVLHTAFSDKITVWGARPNLALTALLTACLFVDGNTGALLGFFVGLLEGSYAAMYVGSFLVTRTISGWQVGLLEQRVFRDSLPVVFLVVLGGTILTESCFFLFAPKQHLLRWLTWLIQTLTGALYNTVLAVPLYLLLRRLILPRSRV